jgi:4-hydroxy-2-oxoheptanedioate aldolase
MKQQTLHECWAAGRGAVNGWCSIPSSITAEMLSNQDFDSVTIDLQHGLVDYQTALTMLQAMSASGRTPLARVPWNEPGIIMKMLDAGALGIICPMINTAEDAARFVGATKYTPDGYRSSGPTRALMVHGADYHAESNAKIVSMAMVETVEAVGNVEAIAATPGLTGIYIGPSDLAITMGFNPGLDRREPEMVAAIDRVLKACKANGIKAGLHCMSPGYIKEMFALGFDFASLSNDVRILSQALATQIAETRK